MLKKKGKDALPKSGPKKRRAKSEEEARRQAVEEHGARGAHFGRKTGKVRTYSYKKTKLKSKPKRKLSLDKSASGLNDRNRRQWEPWEEEILFVEPSKVLDELTKRQLQCEHKALKSAHATANLASDMEWRTCPSCQVILRWWGSYTTTIQAEWQLLRLDGYSMPEWGELFTKDKSLWLFILEEAFIETTGEGRTNA